MDGFPSFAYLLHHDHLRQRIVGLLMVGTRWSHMEFAFKRGCPKHAEWRWGTIGELLDRILQVLPTLRLVWDPAKFTEKQFKDLALFDNDKKGLNMHDCFNTCDSKQPLVVILQDVADHDALCGPVGFLGGGMPLS